MPSVGFPALFCCVLMSVASLDLRRFFSDGSQIEALTPSFASKCGFSVDSDPWGNTKVYGSLLNCFAGNEVRPLH